MTSWTVVPTAPDRPVAVGLVRRYLADIIGRYYGRPATENEIDLALADDPTDDLLGFFVGYRDGVPAGCVAFRMVDRETAELKRVYVEQSSRRSGGGGALLAAVERAAVSAGAGVIRLDTRSDLVEARALYAARGYREVPAFNSDRYAGHWFEKRL
ncbi:GNAT family N-acetyltransferase [Actinosynnema sp. NPDC020468]|uniref:GNAT family N-acetyltransferase n=1 Tax=Actinosynnema sp. NPDC020468 TaxID=3154488 RepID=UPI0033FAF3A4